MSALIKHMVSSHYLAEIKQRFSDLYDSTSSQCTLCNKVMSKHNMWQHLGSVHFKLEEILESEGRRPLRTAPMPMMMKVDQNGEEIPK